MSDGGELGGTKFFDAVLDAAAIDALHAASRRVVFRRGAVLMRQGEPGASMFTIVSGKVAVSVHEPGGERKVAELGPDDYVGEMSLAHRRAAHRHGHRQGQGGGAGNAQGGAAADPRQGAAPLPPVRRPWSGIARSSSPSSTRITPAGTASARDPAEVAARMTAFYSG